jgi:DNA-binding HxlR family transcriptional regulator
MLSRKILLFIETLYPDKKVTKDDFRRTLPLLSYYGISAYLRDNGIITLHTVNERNQKVWALTDKGKKFAGLVMEMKRVLNNGVTEKGELKMRSARDAAFIEDT